MKKLFLYVMSVLGLFTLAQACNEDSTVIEPDSSDTAVYTFAFQSDTSVLKGLDSVFFSIDLVRGEIFNADSMPMGTNISKLVPTITATDNVSALRLTYKNSEGRDSLYDYLSSPGDTVDFSNGPVVLTVVSPSGSFSRNYNITVNVHKMKSDSLSWGESEFSAIPSNLSTVKAQRTVANDNGTYCLSTDGTTYCLAHTTSQQMTDWQYTTVTLPADADVASFAAAADALYILDAQGKLYSSTDGSQWTVTGRTWKYIYGECVGTLGGASVDDNGNYIFEQYPDGVSMAIPADMPVSGTSVPVTYKASMADQAQCVILGGRKADGSLTNHAWGFDGNNWVKISNIGLPSALEGMTVVPFFTYYINRAFVATEYSVFMAFGGINGSDLNTTVYITKDFGMTWAEASKAVQLPETVTIGAYAQGFMRYTTMYPGRATRPVEEWECPYLYMFGGVDAQGQLYNSVWRGTLNRMTFKPII